MKRFSPFWSLAGVFALALLAAGCEDPVATPLESDAEAQLAQGQAAGFPVVIVRQGGGPPGGTSSPVTADFADAMAKVGNGGTIRVFPGTYTVDEVIVDKPVTIEPAGGARPVIHVPGPASGFDVNGVTSGTVTFRGLDFDVDGWTGIAVVATYDEVLVEDNAFDIGATAGVYVGATSVSGGRVRVENSSFTGGRMGIFASGAPRMDVLNSTFSDHGWSGIQYQVETGGLIQGNELSRCGPHGCIRIHRPSGVDVVGNSVTNEAPRPVGRGIVAFSGGNDVRIEDNDVVGVSDPGETAFDQGIAVEGVTDAEILNNRVSRARTGIHAVHVSGRIAENVVDPCGPDRCINVSQTIGPVEISDNVLRSHLEFRTFMAIGSITRDGEFPLSVTDNLIEGVGEPADRNDPSTWPLDIAFQHNSWDPGQSGARGPAADFSGNRVVRAAVGVRAFHGGVVEGTDNTFETLFGEALGAHDHAINRIQRSDITDYQQALGFSDDGVLEVTCNWWGSTGGPHGVWGVPSSAYTPWATEPIAGQPSVSCP